MYYVNFTIDLCPEKTSDLPEVDGKLYHMIELVIIRRPLQSHENDFIPSNILLLLFVVFNATFNNISVISWRSVSMVVETRFPNKITDLQQVTDKLYHI